MSRTIFEKLQLANEKNILIQGLPSSVEKQFSKLSYAKNVTPLLKARKIEFALIFVLNENQLNGVLHDVLPCIEGKSKLWIAFPKSTSKLITDLNRESSWFRLTSEGYESVERVEIDHVWSAMKFERVNEYQYSPSAHNIEESNERSLYIEIEFPEEIGDQDCKAIAINLAILADTKHREQGGHGLEIKEIRVEDCVTAGEGALA